MISKYQNMNEARSNSYWKMHVYGQISSRQPRELGGVTAAQSKCRRATGNTETPTPRSHTISDVSSSPSHFFPPFLQLPSSHGCKKCNSPLPSDQLLQQFLGQRTRQEWNHCKFPKGAASLLVNITSGAPSELEQVCTTCPCLHNSTGSDFLQVTGASSQGVLDQHCTARPWYAVWYLFPVSSRKMQSAD